MKRLQMLAGLFFAVACSGLHAQSYLTANIPFDFQVGSRTMPAGDYRINYSSHILVLRTEKRAAVVLTVPSSRDKVTRSGVLEFRRYGDSYFFASVWTPNSVYGGAILKTAHEREVALRTDPLRSTAIALNSH